MIGFGGYKSTLIDHWFCRRSILWGGGCTTIKIEVDLTYYCRGWVRWASGGRVLIFQGMNQSWEKGRVIENHQTEWEGQIIVVLEDEILKKTSGVNCQYLEARIIGVWVIKFHQYCVGQIVNNWGVSFIQLMEWVVVRVDDCSKGRKLLP